MKDWHTIDGYFEDVDQKDYDSLVWQIPHGGKMVEVGCYRGKSLGSIAQTIIDKDISVLAVDIFDIIYMPGYDAMPTLERSFDDFRDNIAESVLNKNVKTLIQTRVGAARHEMGLGSKFDLIFLDADHSYKGIREDIESWWPCTSTIRLPSLSRLKENCITLESKKRLTYCSRKT